MKKVFALIIVGLCLLFLTCCNNEEPENETRVQQGEPSLYINSEETEHYSPNEARLIVNGKDITQGNYVRIDRAARHAEIPIIAILKELGYDVEIEYDQNMDSYAVIIDEFVFIDTQYQDFSIHIGYGDTDYVRSIIDDQIIVDSDSVFTQLYWSYNAEIEIDYTTNTVYVNSFDPYGSATYDARLVVNGKDITEETCVSFQEYHNGIEIELPLLAVVEELGAQIQWQGETVVAITYKGETRTYDTSKDDFGVYGPEGGVITRRIENSDLIFDLNSIDGILEEVYGVTVTVDEDDYVVYVNSIK